MTDYFQPSNQPNLLAFPHLAWAAWLCKVSHTSSGFLKGEPVLWEVLWTTYFSAVSFFGFAAFEAIPWEDSFESKHKPTWFLGEMRRWSVGSMVVANKLAFFQYPHVAERTGKAGRWVVRTNKGEVCLWETMRLALLISFHEVHAHSRNGDGVIVMHAPKQSSMWDIYAPANYQREGDAYAWADHPGIPKKIKSQRGQMTEEGLRPSTSLKKNGDDLSHGKTTVRRLQKITTVWTDQQYVTYSGCIFWKTLLISRLFLSEAWPKRFDKMFTVTWRSGVKPDAGSRSLLNLSSRVVELQPSEARIRK